MGGEQLKHGEMMGVSVRHGREERVEGKGGLGRGVGQHL